MVDLAAAGLPVVVEGEDDDRIVAEVLIDGAPMANGSGRPCPHTVLTFQNVAGTVTDDDGVTVRWVLRVRVRCSQCAVPFDVVPGSARNPQDHPVGIVFDLVPLDHDDPLVATLPVEASAD